MDPLGLTHVVVTHVHVDHAYGLPSLVRQLMLLGRRTPLAVVCRPEHVEPLRALLTTFPGDTTMSTVEQVKSLAKGGSARIQR